VVWCGVAVEAGGRGGEGWDIAGKPTQLLQRRRTPPPTPHDDSLSFPSLFSQGAKKIEE
jgi:hypothetical protein